jgi:hypothetical protein
LGVDPVVNEKTGSTGVDRPWSVHRPSEKDTTGSTGAGMDMTAVQQLKDAVYAVRSVVDHQYPGAARPFGLMDVVDTQDGFAVSNGTGVGLIHADVTDAPPGAWSLQLTSAIAFDVPGVGRAAAWVNERNRHTVLGKYYYAVASTGDMCAVMWETLIWSRLLDGLFDPASRPALQWTMENVRECVEIASAGAAEFVQEFGGRILNVNDQDMTLLFVASSAG